MDNPLAQLRHSGVSLKTKEQDITCVFSVYGGSLSLSLRNASGFFFRRPIPTMNMMVFIDNLKAHLKDKNFVDYTHFGKWDTTDKKAATDWGIAITRDDKRMAIMNVKIDNGKVYSFPMRGPFLVTIGNEELPTERKSDYCVRMLIEYLQIIVPIQKTLSDFKRDFTKQGDGGDGSSEPKGSSAPAPVPDDETSLW